MFNPEIKKAPFILPVPAEASVTVSKQQRRHFHNNGSLSKRRVNSHFPVDFLSSQDINLSAELVLKLDLIWKRKRGCLLVLHGKHSTLTLEVN